MCGIFGYVTNKEEALGPILIAAAEQLTHRSYDSVGAATINDGKIDLRKDVGKVDSVALKYNIAEMRAQRGITIGEEDTSLRANGDDLVVILKSDAQISALLGVLPLQLLSYHMSVMRGFDPDFPRNLSKTLTVD